MILTARDLRALLRHFELPDDGSQEDLLKRLKYFLIKYHLFGIETAKQTSILAPRPKICESDSSNMIGQDEKPLETQDGLKEREEVTVSCGNLKSNLIRNRGFKDRKAFNLRETSSLHRRNGIRME